MMSGMDSKTLQKDRGTALQELRKERETALLSIGKIMHKLIRDVQITDETCKKLSDSIAELDNKIKTYENADTGTKDNICPNPKCGQKVSSQAGVFCVACGVNMAEYRSRNMIQCPKCNHMTTREGDYCTICGTKFYKQGES